jgi:hypothetical protein
MYNGAVGAGTPSIPALEAVTVTTPQSTVPSIDLIGQVFGRLTVISWSRDKEYKVVWICKCTCGKETKVNTYHLQHGKSRSCGCLRDELTASRTTHGQSRVLATTAEYRTWSSMKRRCNNPNTLDWPLYGGRGVRVCREWEDSFEAFFNYIGKRPNSTMSIDRYPDTNGNYEPGNVRWATPSEQIRGRRQRTHCKRGHALSDDNVYIDHRHGGRICKTCRAMTSAAYDKSHPHRKKEKKTL